DDPLILLSVRLGISVTEAYHFMEELSSGNLECSAPQGNTLLGSTKELQSVLRHLLWQLECVAQGDYSQTVDFLGDFSKSFNLFTHQIALREKYQKEASYLKQRNLEQKNYLLSEQINQQLTYYENLKDAHNVVRSVKHDLANHYFTLNELLKNDDVASAQEYLRTLYSRMMTLEENIFHTGNPIFDALLTDKISKAKQKGISIATQLVLEEDLKISNMDWCILIGNIMDNAIEACEQLDKEEKSISVQARSYKNIFNIIIKNTALEPKQKQDGFYHTSKEHQEEHGLGLSNVAQVVEKYDGIMQMDYSEGYFILVITLFHVL
ncbi:MAG: GHKL domain-containing protein, partial [Anaerotignum sp.]